MQAKAALRLALTDYFVPAPLTLAKSERRFAIPLELARARAMYGHHRSVFQSKWGTLSEQLY
jgi:hypothetical protein